MYPASVSEISDSEQLSVEELDVLDQWEMKEERGMCSENSVLAYLEPDHTLAHFLLQ